MSFYFLWAFLLLPALGWWAWGMWKNERALQHEIKFFGLPALKTNLLNDWGRIKWALRVAVLALGVFALARPRLEQKEEQIKADVVDILLTMDVSNSMLARDFDPNRLEAAKNVATAFVEKRSNDRFGLVEFGGESFTQCPITTDHRMMKEFLASLECGTLGDGTAIGMGLATAVSRLKESPVKSKMIILMTDGVNNAGYVQPLTAAELAKTFGIKVYTIGIGTRGMAQAPVFRREDGSFIYGPTEVEIDEALLQEIADMTGGRYFRATDTESLQSVYAEIDRLERTIVEASVIRRHSEEYRYFLIPAFCLFVLEMVGLLAWFRPLNS